MLVKLCKAIPLPALIHLWGVLRAGPTATQLRFEPQPLYGRLPNRQQRASPGSNSGS